MGYKLLSKGPIKVSEEQGNIRLGLIPLHRDNIRLQTVVIRDQKPLIERQIDKTVLNIENSLLAAGNSALEILEKAPGVSVDFLGNISMKGRQSVLIMIDGKPTYLSKDQLVNLLSSTDGNSIKTIELITNPSSKYDAAGNSGIINIRLKKGIGQGTNGTLRLGAGWGNYYKSNAGASLNHREKDFNFFGNYSFVNNMQTTDLTVLRKNEYLNEITYFNRSGRSLSTRINNSYKGGLDYFINKNNTVGFVINGMYTNRKEDLPALTLIGNNPTQADSTINSVNATRDKNSNFGVNLNYRGLLDTLGQELIIDLDYASYNNQSNNLYNNNYFGLPLKESIFRDSAPTIVKIRSGKLDYVRPFSSGIKLEAGIKSSWVSTDNDFNFENFINKEWMLNSNRTNHFVYEENINAAYFSLAHDIKKLSLKYGLRAENTNSKGSSLTLQTIVKRSYVNLFPSLFISHKISKNSTLGFSYSRRIDRPDYKSLNPFIKFVDLYTLEQGNPYLNSQYTNSLEISYSTKKDWDLSLGYSSINDVMTSVLLSDKENKLLYLTEENVARRQHYDFSLNKSLKLTKWWSTQNNAVLFYNIIESPNLLGYEYRKEKLTFRFNSNQTIKMKSSLSVEVSGNYSSAQVYGTYQINPIYSVNIGLGKSFNKGNANLKLVMNDVFNTSIAEINSLRPFQEYYLEQKQESRILRLSFSYKIGKTQIKVPANRAKGSLDEESRVNN